MTRAFRCNDCDNITVDPIMHRQIEHDDECYPKRVSVYAECPDCSSDDLQEITLCPKCETEGLMFALEPGYETCKAHIKEDEQ